MQGDADALLLVTERTKIVRGVFSEVFEMLGYKDHFDFGAEDIGNDK